MDDDGKVSRVIVQPLRHVGAVAALQVVCQKDDMAGLKEQILGSDMVVFVTPLYYFGMSA